MADKDSGSGAPRSGGFLHPLRTSVSALVSTLHTRLELLVTELEEERERFKRTILLMLMLFLCGGLGLILLTIFTVAIFWESGWIYALGVLTVVYLGAGAVAGLLLRKHNLTRPRFFSATLAELDKDRDRLGP